MIVIVDYGMGNLRSVSKALEHLGAEVKVSSSESDIQEAEKLVLPGVGAFGDAMKELRHLRLEDPIRRFVQKKRPFLGICLGLHLLFSSSEESPGVEGLCICPGKVQAFRSTGIKIPHMGWNSIHIENRHPLLKGVPENSFFYFVHSFYAVPERPDLTAASCRYGQEDFSAMIGTESIFATQFHPEKSQEGGLAILKNFIAW